MKRLESVLESLDFGKLLVITSAIFFSGCQTAISVGNGFPSRLIRTESYSLIIKNEEQNPDKCCQVCSENGAEYCQNIVTDESKEKYTFCTCYNALARNLWD